MAKAARWGANFLSVLTGLATSVEIVQLLRLSKTPLAEALRHAESRRRPTPRPGIQSNLTTIMLHNKNVVINL
jgi:hypothetical protein